jgi:hypothetical protein
MIKMMEATVNQPKTNSRMKRYTWSWIVCIGGGLIGGAILGYAENRTGMVLRDTLIILSSIIMTAALCFGAWLYHVSIDEHEKEAVYIANSVGLYAMIGLLFASMTLRLLSDPIIITMKLVIFGAALPALAAFLWKKYR